MKLNEVYTRSIKEVIEGMELIDLKFHTDNHGDVKGVELKYMSKGAETGSESCSESDLERNSFKKF